MLIAVGGGRQVDVSGSFWELLGVEVVSVTEEQAVTRMPLRPDLRGAGSAPFHGGALAALADCTGGLAFVGAEAEVETLPETAYLFVDFLAPATTDVVAASSVVWRRRRSALVETHVRGDGDGLLLHATARYVLP